MHSENAPEKDPEHAAKNFSIKPGDFI